MVESFSLWIVGRERPAFATAQEMNNPAMKKLAASMVTTGLGSEMALRQIRNTTSHFGPTENQRNEIANAQLIRPTFNHQLPPTPVVAAADSPGSNVGSAQSGAPRNKYTRSPSNIATIVS